MSDVPSGQGMKMGELAFVGDQFFMQTPDGVRAVTLRCRVDGVVCVEEVAGGGVTINPVTITMSVAGDAADQIARASDALRERGANVSRR